MERRLVIRNSEDEIYRLMTEREWTNSQEMYMCLRTCASGRCTALGLLWSASASGWLELDVDMGGMNSQELNRVLATYSQKKKSTG